ncbi:hypothetical protein Scep_025415 [Stephania cephalantha]|uniref:Uncharacterized protein n=1 Tax=Stephania cephalantha TaxID=152367 RepID=A0AAP0HRJ4_9MAGN
MQGCIYLQTNKLNCIEFVDEKNKMLHRIVHIYIVLCMHTPQQIELKCMIHIKIGLQFATLALARLGDGSSSS